MKKIKVVSLFILFLLFSLITYGQISTRNEAKTTPIFRPERYDSLSRFHYKWEEYENRMISKKESVRRSDKEILKYIGQTIYFIPYTRGYDSLNSTIYSYQNFRYQNKTVRVFYIVEGKRSFLDDVIASEGTDRKRKTFKKRDVTNIYYAKLKKLYLNGEISIHRLEPKIVTPIDKYQGKYFNIIDFVIDNNDGYDGSIKMVLTDEKKDTLFMKYGKQYWNWGSYPKFMVVGYYEKQKQLYVGKKFVANFKKYESEKKMIDINTGEVVILSNGSKWDCISFDFINNKGLYLEPYLILKNNNQNEIKIKVDKEPHSRSSHGDVYIKSFIEESKRKEKMELEALAESERKERKMEEQRLKEEKLKNLQLNIIKKFGDYYGKLINKGQVVLGMSKEMCRASWGKPYEINVTTVLGLRHEQWVYSLKTYLYFENGKLTAIQN